MKKLTILFSILIASISAFAAVTTTSQITLKSASQGDKVLLIVVADQFSDAYDNGYDATIGAGQQGGLYICSGNDRYDKWATNALATNLPMGFGAVEDNTYTLEFSYFSGTSYTIYDAVADKTITVASNILIDDEPANPANKYTFEIDNADKNSAINDRFVINYVPAPTCDYSREGLTVGKYYTICLPKAVENPEGASFWNMIHRNSEGTLAYLEEATGALVAGRPYIFQAEATSLCFEYSGDAESAGAYGALVGTLAEMNQDALTAAGANIYLLNNNELWLVSGQSGNVLPANRAYIAYNELIPGNPQSAPGRRVRAIPMQANGTTGFENIQASEAPAKMIIDGKMYILRGEQMYDATGRLVK